MKSQLESTNDMFNLFRSNKIPTEVLGINERNLNFVYLKNPRKHFPLADNKVICKEVLQKNNISCAETYGVINRVGDIGACWKQLAHHSKLAIKPANGSGGGGIIILKKDQQGNWKSGGKIRSRKEIFTHMARILMGMYSLNTSDQVLIEQCIEPHPFFHNIFPVGVPDFRVILLHNQIVMSMLRMPTERSDGKANLHQGGLGIGIDHKNGLLESAYDGEKYFAHHPDTKQQITGLAIPHWQAILDLSVQTSHAFPLDYLGIDIVLDKEYGPMVLEINVRPGLGIQLANKKGLKKILTTLNQ